MVDAESSWLEIDLAEPCTIESLKITWWGISVASQLTVLVSDGSGDYETVRTLDDGKGRLCLDSALNDWSVVPPFGITHAILCAEAQVAPHERQYTARTPKSLQCCSVELSRGSPNFDLG